eukprot:11214122-Lingulodinium_polyedra.AAC.1
MQAVRAGVFQMVHSGVLCRTWSRARFRQPGPPILRTRDQLDGVPGSSPADRAKVECDTLLLRRSSEICAE